MQEIFRIIVNLISLIINVSLAYFAVRLMKIFQGGDKEKPLRYISTGILTMALGSSFFSLFYFLGLPSYVHQIGAFVAMIGGGLVLIGLHAEYKIWTSTG